MSRIVDEREAFKNGAKIWLAGRLRHSTESASYSGTICRCSWHSGKHGAKLGARAQAAIGRGSNSAAIDRAKAGIAGNVADDSNVIATR